MGRGAIKVRKQEAKAKKKASRAGQNPSTPLITPAAPAPPSPHISPPASPCASDHAIPEINAETSVDTHAAAETSKEPAAKARKGHRVAPSNRVTRFRGVSADASPQSTGDVTGGTSQVKAAPKQVQLRETLPRKGDDAADELRPVRKSSVAIRTLLQQISSDPNVEEDSTPCISEDEGEGSHGTEADDPEADDQSLCVSDDAEVEIVVPKARKIVVGSGARKKPVKVIAAQEGSESEAEADDNGEFVGFCVLTHVYLIRMVPEAFAFTMEINNRQKGSRSVEIVSSTMPWFSMHEKLAELFGIYPALLHAQYRFSTDPKGSLPLDLTTQSHFETMIALLRPLIVPPRLQSGKRSNRKMKPVTVQVFNRDDEPLSAESRGGSKVSHFCRV